MKKRYRPSVGRAITGETLIREGALTGRVRAWLYEQVTFTYAATP